MHTLIRRLIALLLVCGFSLTLAPAVPETAFSRPSSPVAVQAPIRPLDRPALPLVSAVEREPQVRTIHVGLEGFQEALDRCAGPVLSRYKTGPVVGEHNHCGGAYVLSMSIGDEVLLTGAVNGRYRVSGTKVIPKVSSINVLDFAPLYLQTCYFDGVTMRLVGLHPSS